MGTDIHIITQIKKRGVWELVPEIPKSLNCRNYGTFAFLANVRNNFSWDGFEPKGLPSDFIGKKLGFESYKDYAKERYEREKVTMVKLPDGSYIETTDERLKVICNNEKEAQQYDNYRVEYAHGDFADSFTGYDPSLLNGETVSVPVKEIMDFDEFIKSYYGDDWDEEMQDYGFWSVDFGCCDYHSHSYLTLQELIDKDKSGYISNEVEIPADFFYKFKELGGVLPDGMTAIESLEDSALLKVSQAFKDLLKPDILIRWQPSEDEVKNYLLIKGIEELKEIASKYDVDYDSIRIVFAFDN